MRRGKEREFEELSTKKRSHCRAVNYPSLLDLDELLEQICTHLRVLSLVSGVGFQCERCETVRLIQQDSEYEIGSVQHSIVVAAGLIRTRVPKNP